MCTIYENINTSFNLKSNIKEFKNNTWLTVTECVAMNDEIINAG